MLDLLWSRESKSRTFFRDGLEVKRESLGCPSWRSKNDEKKRMAKTQPVPCVVREGGIAEDDSLAENDERVGLHPLDQFRAFKTLSDTGLSEEDIAARHFVSPAIVKQRLASVSPKLHEVYAEDGMTLEQLMAFSVTADQVRQEQVWENVSRSGYDEP